MTVSIWQAEDRQPVRETEFLVVGGGLVGCAAAYFAAQAGRQVIITEMRDLALGASGRNAGFMITGLDAYYHHAIERYGADVTRELYALSQRTHTIWHEVIARHPQEVRFERCGSLLLAECESEADDLRLAYAAMRADNLSPILHENDPLGRGYFGGIEQPQDGAVQPVELTRAVFSDSGAELVDNNELYKIEQQADDHVLVYTRKFIFRAQHVILCTNAYSPLIDPYFVGKIIPTRAQVLATEPLDKAAIATCGYSDYGFMYYRMTFDGRLLIGGGRKQNKLLENDTTEDRTNDAVQGVLDNYLRTWFPEVSAPVARRWSGIMGFTPDGLPIVGTLPEKPRVGFAVGFNGHGLAMGAGTAEKAVQHLLHGEEVGALHVRRLEAI